MTIRFLSPTAAAYDTTRIESDQTMMAAFYAQAAQAIDGEGQPVFVFDHGTGATRRYTWERVVEPGTADGQLARWRNDRWQAEGLAGIQRAQVYPYFVLTPTDSPAEVVTALTAWVADNQIDMTGEDWSVANRSGSGAGLSFLDGNRLVGDRGVSSAVYRAWQAAGAAPYWWSLIPAGGRPPDAWWVTYRTSNEPPAPRIFAAWHQNGAATAADFSASDFMDAGPNNNFTPPAGPGGDTDAAIAFWLPNSVTGLNNVYSLPLATASNPAWYYTLLGLLRGVTTPLTLGGVAGRYVVVTNEDPTDWSGSFVVSVAGDFSAVDREDVQPHPDVVREVVRIAGNTYDAARGQLVGEQPQAEDVRVSGNSPWGFLNLKETPDTEGVLVEPGGSMSRNARGRRGLALPAMYYGWTDRGQNVDFSTLSLSEDLRGVIPRHQAPRARLTIWAADTFLLGLHCFELLIAGDADRETCDTEPRAAPDGRSGRLFVTDHSSDVADYADRAFRIVPSEG